MWLNVDGSCLSLTFVRFSAIVLDAFGLFIIPLEEEFGWNRTQTNAGFSIGLSLSGVWALLSGAYMDKHPQSTKYVFAHREFFGVM
jgi:hypothetical protein